jgi:diacylglycerol kinase family enzyme
VGRIEGKHFLNAAGFGFDVAVIEDVARSRRLSGQLAYFGSALRQLFSYRGLPIAVAADGAPNSVAEPHLMLVVANGRHFGGTFRIAPAASLVDGRLDAVAIGPVSALRRVRLFAAATGGTHLGHAEVRVGRRPPSPCGSPPRRPTRPTASTTAPGPPRSRCGACRGRCAWSRRSPPGSTPRRSGAVGAARP